MPKKRLPYYRKLIECPVCRNFTNNFVLKSKIFVPEQIDTDTYVISYTWLDENRIRCEPSFYALWTCTTCGYSDFPEYFESYLNKEWSKFEELKEVILEETRKSEGVLCKLVSQTKLDGGEIDFETAMNMHLLAIYCNDVIYPENMDYEKVGRLYLRTAWLYRDYRRLKLPKRPFGGCGNYWAFLKSVQPLWPTIPLEENISLEQAAEFLKKIIYSDFTYEQALKNMKFILLAAELYLKLDDFKSAYQMVHSVIKLGYEARREIKRALDRKNKDELATPESRRSFVRMDKITDQLYDVHEKYREIKDKWVACYADVIEEVASENPDQPPQVLLEILEKKNIPRDVVDIVERQDERFQVIRPQKRGFWDYFR